MHNTLLQYCVTAAVIVFSANKAYPAESLLDELSETEIPMVLTASRLRTSIVNSPAAVTILDAQLLKNAGVRSIADIFLLVPGMQVGRYAYGDPVVTYNGQAARNNPRIQVLIDGRPTYVPLYGGVPWSELPIILSDIERVEIIRGPNAATFGPNSFSGVISIITYHSRRQAFL